MLPWSHPSPYPKRYLDRFSHFCTAHGRRSLYFTLGCLFSRQNCPFALGIWLTGPVWVHNPNSMPLCACVKKTPFRMGFFVNILIHRSIRLSVLRHAYRAILKLNGSNDVFLEPLLPLGGRDEIAPHLGGQIPPKTKFGGMNRHFQAKLIKSKNMHIIKTTASILTKFCTAIKTTKCPSWVVWTHA